ncbi:MAG: DUF1573 domain-containing protein [Chitinophagales bacterium]|nr:DUF1573 domain-containing protein [Chitinophagales bacterium]
MKSAITLFIVIISFLSLSSCHQDEKLSQKTDVINKVLDIKDGDGIVDEDGTQFNEVDGLESAKKDVPKSRITYTETKVDLGEVDEGEQVHHTFEFKNTGNEPLYIYDAQGSCGCTIPTYSKEPIAPGANGSIEVVFNSKGRPGFNTKTVTVTANTNPDITELQFTVKVNPKAE